jgi:hypothetical protein
MINLEYEVRSNLFAMGCVNALAGEIALRLLADRNDIVF